MKQILVIKPNGETSVLPKHPHLNEMRRIVGGHIEYVSVLDRIEDGKRIMTAMFVNEEGLLSGLPRNDKATEIYQRNVRTAYPNDPNPFKTARDEYLRSIPPDVKVIDASPGYNWEDPHVVGTVIYFEGYTEKEAEEEYSRVHHFPDEPVTP